MRIFKQIGCRAVRQELWDYAGERLPEGPMERVERHLTACGACRWEVESLRRAQNMLAEVQQETLLPAGFGWADLQRRLEAQGASPALSGPDAADTRRVVSRLLPRRRFALPEMPRLATAGGFALTFAFVLLGYQAFRAPVTQSVIVPVYFPAASSPANFDAPNLLPTANTFALAPQNSAAPAPPQPKQNKAIQQVAATVPTKRLPLLNPKPRSVANEPRPTAPKPAPPAPQPKENKIEFTPRHPGEYEPAQEPDEARHGAMETVVPVTYDTDSVY